MQTLESSIPTKATWEAITPMIKDIYKFLNVYQTAIDDKDIFNKTVINEKALFNSPGEIHRGRFL